MRPVNYVAAAMLVSLALLGGSLSAVAAAVDALYEGVVSGELTEAGRPVAAADALRQVVVRVSGRRSAATDPALASLYADAPRLAQTFRSGSAGQVVVAFDPAALDARLAKAGQRIWSRERPVTLVVLVAPGAAAGARFSAPATAAARREVQTAAQVRGLPLTWPVGLSPVDEAARYQDALAGRTEPLLEVARQAGADGVLLGRVSPTGVAWSYAGTAGEVAASGTATDAVQELADRYGAQLAAAPADAGRLVAVVRGIHDLGGYASAYAAVAAIPNVRSVALEEVTASRLRFRLGFDGDTEALRRAVRESGRLQIDESAPSGGELQLVLRP
jgi:hypothetical protein